MFASSSLLSFARPSSLAPSPFATSSTWQTWLSSSSLEDAKAPGVFQTLYSQIMPRCAAGSSRAFRPHSFSRTHLCPSAPPAPAQSKHASRNRQTPPCLGSPWRIIMPCTPRRRDAFETTTAPSSRRAFPNGGKKKEREEREKEEKYKYFPRVIVERIHFRGASESCLAVQMASANAARRHASCPAPQSGGVGSGK